MKTNKRTYAIQNNSQLFSKSKREKRGIIKAVGKIDKWLFGTLESDDVEKYDKYFSTLLSNQQTLQDEPQNEDAILTNVINTYISASTYLYKKTSLYFLYIYQ